MFASAARGAGGARKQVVGLVMPCRADEAGIILPKVAFVAGGAVGCPGYGAASSTGRRVPMGAGRSRADGPSRNPAFSFIKNDDGAFPDVPARFYDSAAI